MPVPFVIAGAALAAAAFGAKKHYDAMEMSEEAEQLVRNAEFDFEQERERLMAQKEALGEAAKELAALRKNVEVTNIRRFVTAASEISDINYQKIRVDASLPDVQIPSLAQFDQELSAWSQLPTSGAKGIALGLMGAASASSLATSVGVASTGTAISSLGGVAATNATLAWLGGGSLAAGGFGMAGGMAVLGGVVAGPLVAITGLTAAKNAQKMLTRAREREADIKMMTEQVKDAQLAVAIIQERVSEVGSQITLFIPYFDSIIDRLEALVVEQKRERERLQRDAQELRAAYARVNVVVRFFHWLFRRAPRFDYPDPLQFKNLSPSQKEEVGLAMLAATNLKSIININIIDEAGVVTAESEAAVQALEAQRAGKTRPVPVETTSTPAGPAWARTLPALLAVLLLVVGGLVWRGWPEAADVTALEVKPHPEQVSDTAEFAPAEVFYPVGSAPTAASEPGGAPAPETMEAGLDAGGTAPEQETVWTIAPTPERGAPPQTIPATAAPAVSAAPAPTPAASAPAESAPAGAVAPARPLATAPAGVNPVVIERMLARANALLREGRGQEAAAVAGNILAFDPTHAEALRIREAATYQRSQPRW